MNLDVIGYNMVSNLIPNYATLLIKIITNLGGEIFLISITILLLLLLKNKSIGKAIGINLIMSSFINFTLKNIFQRERPVGTRLIDVSGYSFPSGHSMVSMAFYGFFIYLIFKYMKNMYLKGLFITILSLLILAIGISRIYLGVHYTTDVLGGYIVGIIYLNIYVRAINIIMAKDE